MKKYTISSKLKPQKEQDIHCEKCNDGKCFDNVKLIRTDMGCDDTYEKGCQACLSKYVLPYTIFGIDYDTDKGVEVFEEELDAFDYNVPLTEENKVMVALSVAKNFTIELLKQTTELKDSILEYEETHLCFDHKYINSIPLTTSEGTFTLQICGVCKICNFVYKGKTYRQPLKIAIDFLTAQGEKFNKEKKKALSDVSAIPKFNTDVFGVNMGGQEVEKDEEGILVF